MWIWVTRTLTAGFSYASRRVNPIRANKESAREDLDRALEFKDL